MSINSKMTALADEIRELSGTTTTKSIDAMTSDVDAANAEIAEQAELLEQIAAALEGKASGSGGSNVNIEAWTGKIAIQDDMSGESAMYYTDENLATRIVSVGGTGPMAVDATITIAAGTAIYFSHHRRNYEFTAAEEITAQVDKDNYLGNVICPTANNFIING